MDRYEIVRIGDPLLIFFTLEPERFGVVHPNSLINDLNRGGDPPISYLMDELPHLKHGYAFKESIKKLMQLYIDLNLNSRWGSGKITPDAYMNEIFGGPIPVSYYIFQQNEKIPLEYALERNLIDQIPNTYRACRIPPTSSWSKQYIDRIVDVNVLPYYRLDEQSRNDINNMEQELLAEYYLIHQTNEEFDDILHNPDDLKTYRDYLAPNPIKEPF